MPTFKLFFTGDYLDESGAVAGDDPGLEELRSTGYIEPAFLEDQKPAKSDTHYWDRLYSLEVTPEHIANANGIVVFRPWVKKSAFSQGADQLVVLARAGAGVDKIDIAACTANGVAVFNTPDTLTHSTASAALTLMLALAKRLFPQQELVRTGRWDRQPEFLGDDLMGATLGIVGLGKTGSELARLVAPFNMRVLSYSPKADRSQAETLSVQLVTLETLLSNSDFVSLHCRLNENTRGMLGPRELKLMKPGAYLINVGRGELVDEVALVDALREKSIAGAGLDVFETEPLPLSHPLLELDNVILTPHWLPSTRRASRATRQVLIENIVKVAQGLAPQNVVNPEVLARPAFQAKLSRFAVNQKRHAIARA